MKSNWLFWGIAALVVYSIAKSAQAAAFVGPINQPGYAGSGAVPVYRGDPAFVGPINQPAASGGGAASNPAIIPGTPMDPQAQLWDPCYSGSLVFDPQACTQSGRLTYDLVTGGY